MSEPYAWQHAPRADFAVIGDPVAHSLSPKMHMAAFRALGLTHRYVAIHVPVGEVPQALDHLADLGYRGVNVTVPHKAEALAWCSLQDPLAVQINAANTVRFSDRSCINTDVPGFLDTLRDLDLPNKLVLLLGAGGSARAVLVALNSAGYEVAVWNRTPARAEALCRELFGIPVSVPGLQNAGLVVNTTSASLQGSSVHVEWSSLFPDAVAYDLMYSATHTPFLEDAASHGYRALDGRNMLAAQGAHSFEYWLGVPAPLHAMREALG